ANKENTHKKILLRFRNLIHSSEKHITLETTRGLLRRGFKTPTSEQNPYFASTGSSVEGHSIYATN
ncbi:hypothetical protein QIH12_26660, partial [Klebsiella pneumoniae]|nr:hypothetical protein [Klebsiella pneumoniae]